MSWFLAALGFMVLIVLHEAGHFAAAKAVGMKVERFALFFPPLLLRKKKGETEYALGAIPLGGYVKITGMNPSEELSDEERTRAYYSQDVWKRVVVIAAGPIVNLIVGFLLLVAYAAFVGPHKGNAVGDVAKDFPAQGVLQEGDLLISVDGKRGETDVLAKQVASHKCAVQPPVDGCGAATPAKLVIERDGQRRTLELTPVYDEKFKRTRLGFSYDLRGGPRVTLPPGKAVDRSVDVFWNITKQTVSIPAKIIDPVERKQINGIVGSYETTRQVILADAGDVLFVLAIISVSLAIVNLFPFLPLDGGHIFWAVVEKVRRRPVAYSTMERSGVIGFALVLMLFVIGLSNDIGQLQDGGFKVR